MTFRTEGLTGPDRLLVFSGIAAPISLLISVLVAGAHQPGYSHLSQAISVLGAQGSPNNEILNIGGLMVSGLLTFFFSLAMFRFIKINPVVTISSALVAFTGIGRFFAGIFQCDPGCIPITTLSGRLHALTGMIALFCGAIAPLLMASGLRKTHPVFVPSLILGSVSLLAFITLVSGRMQPYFGGIQRLLLVLTYTWIIWVAVRITRKDF
jgi:hypothetical membrane protein